MLETLVKFAECCRAWDLRVSTLEVLDCAKHLSISELNSQDDFKTIIGANFAKSRREQNRFEKIFDFYFNDRPLSEKNEKKESAKDQIREIINELPEEKTKMTLDKSLADFVTGDPSQFIEQVVALQNAEENSKPRPFKSNLAQLSGKLKFMFAILNMRDNILKTIDQSSYDADTKEMLIAHFSQSLETAQHLVSKEPDVYNDSIKESKSKGPEDESLFGRSFASLTPGELIAMKDVIDQLAKKLKDIFSRRHAAKNKGVLDVKKTLRNSGKYQGVPLDIRYKNKTMKKSRIVTLCDVSGSVWSTSRFMLHFLYSLQECFSQIRSFVFVSDIAEITDFFKDDDIEKALDKALSKADINYNDYTDYGMAFQSFKANHMPLLDKRTTLIILGDGRSNYQNPQSNILAEFRGKTRRVIWLTPEPADTWYTGDSEIHSYRKHCHELCTCMNISHLEAFIKRIVL